MASIEFNNVDLKYPIRYGRGLNLKEFILRGHFLGKKPVMEFVHALKQVTFSIREGERVGIVGYNGAGKSTILRTIGGVYPIASGERVVLGKMCSLFDIGLGFEQESNGYENIRYRAYLQGETPRTLKDKVQEIADFCELGQFLDIPIKYYSAGMLMRLAFSIATSSDPEILLIDEVFGTGDMVFRRKAQLRLHNLLHRAQIVVMVGHDLGFLEKFCTRVLWMDQGRIREDGATREVIKAYCADADGKRQAA